MEKRFDFLRFYRLAKYNTYKSLLLHCFQEVSHHCVLPEISYFLTAQWASLRLGHPEADALLAEVVHAGD
jgi:hypothetical protein